MNKAFFEKLKYFSSNVWPIIESTIALVIAMGVDMAFNYVFFSFISVDDLTRKGFTAIVFLIVFFKVWALRNSLKYGKTYRIKGIAFKIPLLWLVFSIVTLYGGTSFSLLDIKYQSDNIGLKNELIEAAKTNTELIKLDADIAYKKQVEKENQRQYAQASKRETMDDLKPIWEGSIRDRESAEIKRSEYYDKITALEIKIKADEAFEAIPTAINSGKYLQLIFLILIFSGIEGSIFLVVSVSTQLAERKKDKNTGPESVETAPQESYESERLKSMRESTDKLLSYGNDLSHINEAAKTLEKINGQEAAINLDALAKFNTRQSRTRGPYNTRAMREQAKIQEAIEPNDSESVIEQKKQIEVWSHISWYSYRQDRKVSLDKVSQIVDKKTVLQYCDKKGLGITEEIYDMINEYAIKAGVIDDSRNILEGDIKIVNAKIFKAMQ